MKIGIASDHRGYKLKEFLKNHLDYEMIDYGTTSEESVDYPDFGISLGEAVAKGNTDLGIAICGSGIGISIACNKVKGIRCAKVSNKQEAKSPIVREYKIGDITYIVKAVVKDGVKEDAATKVRRLIHNDLKREKSPV